MNFRIVLFALMLIVGACGTADENSVTEETVPQESDSQTEAPVASDGVCALLSTQDVETALRKFNQSETETLKQQIHQ